MNISAASVDGRLSLRFVLENGRTTLATVRRTQPFHVLRPLSLDPARPHLTTVSVLNATAGLFAGDRLCLHVAVGDEAAVQLTTPTMTRVHAMRAGCAVCAVRLRVAAGGYLEYLPEPLLLCRDAALLQETEVDVAAGGAAAIGEVIAFGRRAHGEGHAYRRLRTVTEARRDGAVVVADALDLLPHRTPMTMGAVGDAAAYGSLMLLTPNAPSTSLLDATRGALDACAGVVAGASLLPLAAGVAVRVLGETAAATRGAVVAAVAVFRAEVLRCDAERPSLERC